jgi:transcription initiation factor IIF auxiliary subunit
VTKFAAPVDSHYITPSMRKEIYDYMQVSSVPLSRQKQLTVDYGKTDHLLKAHQLYTDNKKDYVANRAQDKKTIVDLSKLPPITNFLFA